MAQLLDPLKDLEVFILPFPTPFPVGNVNLYLVRKDPITLIDTGPRTPQAYRALLKA